MGRWSRLIYGITRNQRKGKRSMEISLKWASISRKLMASKKTNSLNTLGKWNVLIRGLLKKNNSHQKQRIMALQGRWNILIKGLLRDNKVIPKWSRLVLELGTRR